jgi:prolyl-tRNA editing enzyme YbaK/EbsC (Cys-tRNA(Pro) deacylase)
MATRTPLTKHLDTEKADYTPVTHRTVFTAYDLAQTLREDLGKIVKTLLVKTEDGLRLVVLPASKRLNLKKIKKALNAKKVVIASEKDMVKYYKVKPGAIHAFGSFLERTPVIVDRTVAKARDLVFPTGNFTESIRMKAKAYLSLENPLVASITDAAKLKRTSKSATERAKDKKKRAKKAKKSATRKKTAERKTTKRTQKRRTAAKKRRRA